MSRRRARNSYRDLEAWLDDTHLQLSEAADLLDISVGHFCGLVHKKVEPSYRLALRLMRVAKVPFESFLTSPLED